MAEVDRIRLVLADCRSRLEAVADALPPSEAVVGGRLSDAAAGLTLVIAHLFPLTNPPGGDKTA